MTNKNQRTGEITEGLSLFKEYHEDQIILLSTPKRLHKIKIFVPISNFARWKIVYEDGTPIPELSDGYYLSRMDAIRAVTMWERSIKKTQEAKQFEIFGDKKPPILKRKKTRGPRA